MLSNICKFMLLAATVAATSACSSDPDDLNSLKTEQLCYAIVTDTQTSAASYSSAVTVGLNAKWSDAKADATFSNLTIDGNVYPEIILTNMKWKTANRWSSVTTSTPKAALSNGAPVDVNDFKFQWADSLEKLDLGAYYDPSFVFSFTLDDRYEVKGAEIPFCFWGSTTATSDGVDPFTSGINDIYATPDFEKMTMTVLVKGAQFAEKMPALNIQIDDIPMKIINGGDSFTFEAADLIPSIGGTPYPNYPCSNIKGSLDPKTGMSFVFDCNVMGRKIYTVTTQPTVFGY